MLKVLKKMWDEFVYGGHLPGAVCSAIALSTVYILDSDFKWLSIMIPYLLAIIIYNYNHLREKNTDMESNPERVEYLRKQEHWIMLSMALYLILLTILMIQVNALGIVMVMIILTGGILYTEIIKKMSTKKFIGLKNIYTSFFLSLLVLYILIANNTPIDYSAILLFLFVFLSLLVNTIFFDIKDIATDRKIGVITIPVLLGKNITLVVLQIMNMIAILPLIFGLYTKLFTDTIVPIILLLGIVSST